MKARRFLAATAREALRKVKEELGPDAIVLANRTSERGVEIMAMASGDLIGLRAAEPAPPQSTPAQTAPVSAGEIDSSPDYQVSLSTASVRAAAPGVQPWQAPAAGAAGVLTNAPARSTRPGRAQPTPPTSPRAAESRPAAPSSAADGLDTPRMSDALMEELKGLRTLVERQLAGFAWSELARENPMQSILLGELLDAGFSPQLARRVAAHSTADNLAAARNEARSAINRGLITLADEADIIDRGGVFALVGPTGVGKTTTTAKLAARCVVRHGAQHLALVTTDGYRIGAVEQLRIYGRILGVPVYAVRDAADLNRCLADLADKHMVLIDTVGVSQRDRQVAEQAAMLQGGGDVRRILLLNAAARGDMLDDVVRAYSGPDLVGAILTKVDEAVSLGSPLDVLIRHELELFFVANGQRVPEDLHLPNRPYLMHRALKNLPEGSAHHLDLHEAGLRMASGDGAGRSGVVARTGARSHA